MRKNDKKMKSINDSPERLNRLVTGTKLVGDISAESNLRVDGEIKGTILVDGKFVLGSTGVIDGDLKATEAEIEGTVKGDIKVEDLLILKKSAIINGAIETARLIIEDGAQLGGSVNTGDIPGNKASTTLKNNAQHENSKSEEKDVVY